MSILLCLLMVNATPDTVGQFKGGVEYNHILEALSLMNLTPADLDYDKQLIPDSFRLKVVSDLMNHPLDVPDYVLASGAKVRACKHPADYFSFMAKEITGKDVKPDVYQAKDIEGRVKEIFSLTENHLNKAFARLSKAERDSLIYTAPSLWSDEADSLEHGYAGALDKEFGVKRDTTYGLKLVDVLRLSRKLDLVEIYAAGATLAQGMEGLIPLAQDLLKKPNPPQLTVDGVSGTVYAVIDVGSGRKVVIGGPGDNVYKGDFAGIIDLGGNDVYEGRAAGAVGELGSPCSFVLDLSGDDVYRNHDKLVNQGAALFGAAMLWDLGGDDSYTAFHIAQGAAIYGAALLIDEKGEDNYHGGYFTQGAGNFGGAALVDHEGNDTYRSYCWTQGLGGPWGYGLLQDDQGNDLYYAGGKYLHLPLDPGDYHSFAQGFGFGWRDVASGGIGFLYDRQGNDKYISEVYGQATSYWFALGMLLDEQGNDSYDAVQYSQGAGIHLSVGALLDLAGDDHYYSRFGPSQGEGHDFAVGWLWDRSGDDQYYASGGQGIGLNNSVGIFVDSRGNDDYLSHDPTAEGGATWSRGTGGIGLFLDLQGQDHYAEKTKGKDNSVWTSGTMALGMDLDALAPNKEPWEDTTAVFPELDTMKTDTAKIGRLFHYACLWNVRADIGKVRTARRMLKDVWKAKAVDYIFNYGFSTYDGLTLEAIEAVFTPLKDTAGYYLFKGLHSPNDTIIRNSIYFLGTLQIKGAGDTLTRMLEAQKTDSLAGALVSALGQLKVQKALPAILKYAEHNKERMRLRVITALASINDTTTVPDVIKRLSDKSFTVKLGAMAAIAGFGKPALVPLEKELAAAKTDSYRTTLIRTLRNVYKQLGDADKTAELKQRLADEVRPLAVSSYPALHDQTMKLLNDVEGRGVLTPTDLFLNPEEVKM